MSTQNFENYLLKSLIQDIDTNNGFPNSKNFTEFEKNFNNSSNSLKDSLTDSSSGSDQDTLAMSPESDNISFSRQEILMALTNQKNTIHLQSTIREMNPFEISHFIKAIQGEIPNIMMDKNEIIYALIYSRYVPPFKEFQFSNKFSMFLTQLQFMNMEPTQRKH